MKALSISLKVADSGYANAKHIFTPLLNSQAGIEIS